MTGLARRIVIQTAGLGVAAGLFGRFKTAAAEDVVARPASPSSTSQAEMWSGEYWAQKGEIKLSLYRKRHGAPSPGEPPRPVLFLVHGSSNSARSSFDLTVPGKRDYSIMDVFARFGFDVWTMDHDGYGHSESSGNNSDIASGVADLRAAAPVVAQESGQQKFHFVGESSGAIRAGAFAAAEPGRVDRLVLVAFTYKGTGSPTLGKRAEQLDFYRNHNRRLRDRAMIRSIFTRDGLASSYEPEVGEALADAELKFGDQVPTGTYLDMTANLPLVDPKKVEAPVLLLRGDHDGIATVEDLVDFYQQLPNGDRQFVILPNTAHSPIFSRNRHLFWHVAREFLTMPAPAVT